MTIEYLITELLTPERYVDMGHYCKLYTKRIFYDQIRISNDKHSIDITKVTKYSLKQWSRFAFFFRNFHGRLGKRY